MTAILEHSHASIHTLSELYNVEEALELAANGKPIKEICKVFGCTYRYFRTVLNNYPFLKQALDQARVDGFHVIAEEVLTLVDDHPGEDAITLRVRSENMKWYLSKVYPSVYGERITIREEHVDLSDALNEARRRVVNPPLLVAPCNPFE